MDATDYPLVFACLFGDEAANALGYAPLGLSSRAGFALALHTAALTTNLASKSMEFKL